VSSCFTILRHLYEVSANLSCFYSICHYHFCYIHIFSSLAASVLNKFSSVQFRSVSRPVLHACTFSAGLINVTVLDKHSCVPSECSDFSRYWMQPPDWYSCHWGSTTSALCSADFTGWRLLIASLAYKCRTWSGANVPVWRTTSTSRHWSQTTTTFCLINVSGRSTYSSVHCGWQNSSCCSRSSVEQFSIVRHCCPFLCPSSALVLNVEFSCYLLMITSCQLLRRCLEATMTRNTFLMKFLAGTSVIFFTRSWSSSACCVASGLSRPGIVCTAAAFTAFRSFSRQWSSAT